MPPLFFLLLLAQDQPAFHSDVALVRVDAEVRQDRQLIDGLAKESFRITDNGKPQTVVYFGHQQEPLDVILLFDARAEMRQAIQRIADTARTALADLHSGDRVALMASGENGATCRASLLSDFSADFDTAGRTIQSQVLRRRFHSRTSLCQIQKGIDVAAQQFLRQPPGNRRRAIVVITDDRGAPTKPSTARDSVRDLWKADAVVLGVIAHTDASGFSIGPPHRGARYAAAQTGGDTLNATDPADGLQEMIHRLRLRYSLYYALPSGKPGQEHTIKVELTPDAQKLYPHATVRARTGYVSP
jgi:VWFA-related protein